MNFQHLLLRSCWGATLASRKTPPRFSTISSKIIHTHTLTFGGQFRYNQLVEYNLGSNGNFGFDGSETAWTLPTS